MRKWNAKERALFALLAAPFAAVLVVGATSSEAAARLWERRFGLNFATSASVDAASEARSAPGVGAGDSKPAALPVLASVAPKLTQSAQTPQTAQAPQDSPLTQTAPTPQDSPLTQTALTSQASPPTQTAQTPQASPLTQTAQTAQASPLTQTAQTPPVSPLTQTAQTPQRAETPEPDWTVAPDGTLERREARSPVDVGRVAVSTAPDGTRGGSAPSPPERTPNGLAPASPPVDLSQGAPVIPGTNDQWARGFEDRWLAVEKERRAFKPIADNSGVYALDSQRPGHTYGNHTERETALWAAETERLVVEGSLIFHDANLLGSKNGVSCDMCHPDAEGTHAETYPKYQVQLGRPALLRDMANWCLTQPCRGEPMSGDDPRMRALEAYMISARAGKTLEYGKR